MKHTKEPVISPYCTARGGVVVLNGPFPLPEAKWIAETIKARYDALAGVEDPAAFMEDAAKLIARNGGPIDGYAQDGTWTEDAWIMVRRDDFDALALAVKAGREKGRE